MNIMNRCEICNWEHKNAIICEICGFFMHYHRTEGYIPKNAKYYHWKDLTVYPFLKKTIENKHNKMHIKIQIKE